MKLWSNCCHIFDCLLLQVFLTDVLEPNKALKDFSTQQINALNINNGNKVIINLPKNSLLQNDPLIGQLLDKIKQNVSTDALFLLTGRHNNQFDEELDTNHSIVVNHRFRRSISEESLKRRKLAKKEDMSRLINIDNCLFFFMRSLNIYYYTQNRENSSVLITSFDSFRNKPTLGDSQCWKSNGEEPAVLDLTYQKTKTELRLKLIIAKNKRL